MASETLKFYRNKSVVWVVPAIVITDAIVCPKGMLARFTTEAPSEMRSSISGAVTGDSIIFIRDEMEMMPAVISIETATVPYLLFLNFDTKNTYIAIHENCYNDFYRKNSLESLKDITVFSKDDAGDYVYDRDTASFIKYNPLINEIKNRQRYSYSIIGTPYQEKSTPFPSFVETADIVFADYTVNDKAIDVYINATISLAGLKLTWASDTNTIFQQENIGIKLGDKELTGSFDNSSIRYTGQRFLNSIKLQPESRVATAIRYKIMTDFVNNGYDDIEIHDINILTEMILAEINGGDNA